jgi:hypothetical protein
MVKLAEEPWSENAAPAGIQELLGSADASDALKLLWAVPVTTVPSSRMSELIVFIRDPFSFGFCFFVSQAFLTQNNAADQSSGMRDQMT